MIPVFKSAADIIKTNVMVQENVKRGTLLNRSAKKNNESKAHHSNTCSEVNVDDPVRCNTA
jgi:ribosomal protein S17